MHHPIRHFTKSHRLIYTVHNHASTLPNSRTRVSVASRDRVVDVDQDTRISVLVRARQRDSRARSSRSATSDSDLGTRDVELRAALGRSSMDGNVLDAEKVVPGRQRLGDSEGERSAILGWEADLAVAERWAKFGDLEPRCATVGRAGFGDFGHVEGWRLLVYVSTACHCAYFDPPVTLWW